MGNSKDGSAVVRYNRNDAGMYVRGVQVWIEPLSGNIDYSLDGMKIVYNGTTYGAVE